MSARGSTDVRPIGPLALGLWFGLAGGFGQSALFALARWGLHHYTRISYQTLWTAPVALACLLIVPAAVIGVVARLRPNVRWWQPTVTLFAFAAAFGCLLCSYSLHWVARYILATGIAVQTGRLAAAHRGAATRLVRRTLPALAGLVVVLGLAVNGTVWTRERRATGALPTAPTGAPNVLLLILDTVRALNLSVYGYARPTTPSLERLAARGVLFERAIAPAPWTLASHATIFTGRLPHELSVGWEVPLDGRFPTLAEAFRDEGYLTAGFAANLVYVSDESGLARGFVHYDAVRVTLAEIAFSERLCHYILEFEPFRELTGLRDLVWRRGAATMRATVSDWLASRGDRPYFAFVNFYDAHNPYLPPAPWDTLFSGRVSWRERNLWVHQTNPVSPEAAAVERNAYDNALAYLDYELGGMLDDLERRGLLRNTIVVVTSDHGEEFGEHGLLSHGNSLYLQSLHVPLILVWPGHVPAGRRVMRVARLRDLAATLLDLAGLPVTLPGRSLRMAWSGDTTAQTTPVAAVAEVPYARGLPSWFPVSAGGMATAVTDTRQIILGGTRREEVFDLARDPTGGMAAADRTDAVVRLRALVPTPASSRRSVRQ